MIKTTEIKILRTLLRHLDVQTKSVMQSRWLIVALWPVIAVWFFVLFQLESKIGSLGVSVGSMLAGAGVATVAIYRGSFQQWIVVRRFLDREAIARRLSELES